MTARKAQWTIYNVQFSQMKIYNTDNKGDGYYSQVTLFR